MYIENKPQDLGFFEFLTPITQSAGNLISTAGSAVASQLPNLATGLVQTQLAKRQAGVQQRIIDAQARLQQAEAAKLTAAGKLQPRQSRGVSRNAMLLGAAGVLVVALVVMRKRRGR